MVLWSQSSRDGVTSSLEPQACKRASDLLFQSEWSSLPGLSGGTARVSAPTAETRPSQLPLPRLPRPCCSCTPVSGRFSHSFRGETLRKGRYGLAEAGSQPGHDQPTSHGDLQEQRLTSQSCRLSAAGPPPLCSPVSALDSDRKSSLCLHPDALTVNWGGGGSEGTRGALKGPTWKRYTFPLTLHWTKKSGGEADHNSKVQEIIILPRGEEHESHGLSTPGARTGRGEGWALW